MKMLLVSRYCAYDAAGYAGSKTHNYYLKRLYKDFDLKLLTIADPADAPKLDFKKYKIDADVVFIDERPEPARVLFFLFYNLRNIPNCFGKTLGIVNGFVHKILLKKLKSLSKLGYSPDCILLEWTQTVLLAGRIKKIFPKAILIASEHDVCFLRFERQFAKAEGIRKIFEFLRFRSVRKAETASLCAVDLIVTQSMKDADLITAGNIQYSKTCVISPFFTDYGDVIYNSESNGILFFGAMDRPENYESAVWFIENVFIPHLQDNHVFYIVGNKPHHVLDKYKSERIAVTGFVPDIRQYLSKSFCMAAPLTMGAGIKVKVIEAMSAGLPVLANDIAIEGIPAVNNVHYLYCRNPGDYAAAVGRIDKDRAGLREISANAKKLVADVFNLDKSYSTYKQAIYKTCSAGLVPIS